MAKKATQTQTQTNGAGAAESAAEKEKRARVTKRIYINDDGQEVESILDASGFQVDVLGSGRRPLTVFLGDYPEHIVTALALFGAQTNLTNVLGSVVKTEGPEAGYEAMEDRHQVFLNGNWSERAGGGPRVGLLADAYIAALREGGREPDKSREDIMAVLRGDEAKRDQFMSSKAVKKHYERLKAEAAQARAEAAAKAAGDGDDLPLI